MKTNQTIMLVEDNPDHVLLAKRALKISGITSTLIVMADGEEALAYLTSAAQQPLPRVILLDLGLPGMSGLDVLKCIRNESHMRDLPVVILSTSDEETDKRESYAIGANSYIMKPIEFNRFVHVIQRLGEYWLHLNEFYDKQFPLKNIH